MPSYPDPEDPKEVPPEYLAKDVVCQLLLKDPSSYLSNEDGTERTMLVPDPKWLEWSPVPIVADPAECYHTYTVCAECADSWGQDYYMKIFYKGEHAWTSPDHPDGSPGDDTPPIWNV